MQFHLILTLDYEVFGNGSGCLDKCLIQPTESLLKLLQPFGANCTFFVDATEFEGMKLQGVDVSQVERQLSELGEHPIQLHLHPQWLDAKKLGDGEWQLAMDKWRIGDLSQVDLDKVIASGLEYLSGFATSSIDCFRAGGWCIQPSQDVLKTLHRHGLNLDSTVAPGTRNVSRGDWFDFRRAPRAPYWSIDSDVCVEAPGGPMLEVPITTAAIGRVRHFKEFWQRRGQPDFPEGCHGSYAGPNSRWQERLGKAGKLAGLGQAMLDFSTLSADAMITVTETYMANMSSLGDASPLPIVAIGHNKNFTSVSQQNLKKYLTWVQANPAIQFSDYSNWRAAASLLPDAVGA